MGDNFQITLITFLEGSSHSKEVLPLCFDPVCLLWAFLFSVAFMFAKK